MAVAPILLIFFNRPDTLEQTFQEIRKAKPKKLYLAQDGARENRPSDAENIEKCRKIVENIDWDCQVFKKYETQNLGCGKGPKTAIDWLFENEEEGIILEDDCVASQSFFSFCTEMLDRYRDDERIFMISGCNSELVSDVKTSYFFGYAGTNCGWATWKRNWVKNDYACSWVSEGKTLESVKNLVSSINKRASKEEINFFIKTNEQVEKGVKLSYWDVQFQATRYLNHQISIIPQKNLITNIGLGPTSTHATTAKIPSRLHDKIGKINATYNQRYELDFPLVHPNYIVEDVAYDKKLYGYLYPSFVKKNFIRAKSLVRRIVKRIK